MEKQTDSTATPISIYLFAFARWDCPDWYCDQISLHLIKNALRTTKLTNHIRNGEKGSNSKLAQSILCRHWWQGFMTKKWDILFVYIFSLLCWRGWSNKQPPLHVAVPYKKNWPIYFADNVPTALLAPNHCCCCIRSWFEFAIRSTRAGLSRNSLSSVLKININ